MVGGKEATSSSVSSRLKNAFARRLASSLAQPDGAISTRSNTIVRQGDRILTVIKPQAHEHDVTDFGDESDFER